MGQICSFFGHAKTKRHSASGGFAPPPGPPPGAVPLDPASGSAPDPPYRLSLRDCHGIRTLCSSKLILKKALQRTHYGTPKIQDGGDPPCWILSLDAKMQIIRDFLKNEAILY